MRIFGSIIGVFRTVSLACLVHVAHAAADEQVAIDQGWTESQKTLWYSISQGSRLLPLSWFKALEQPGSSERFLQSAHMETFRYLARAGNGQDQLPIGFAVDRQSDLRFSEITKLRWKRAQSDREPWVGLNCAACHTGEITFRNKRIRVEGAPTMADFQTFMKVLNRALVATRDDADKWNRFAAAVLAPVDNPGNRDMLRTELSKLIDWQLRVEDANLTPLDYGFARLDAFGHIFNKVLLGLEAPSQFRNPSDAPVSYPFLWNIHQHDKVQWNGIAPNIPLTKDFDIGALGRNVGEVTGVFADLTLRPALLAINGYTTSAQVGNLLKLERQIASLKAPTWPNFFPAIDPDKWEAGKELFTKGPNSCSSCHRVIGRDDTKTRIQVEMTRLVGKDAIGTDPWMACNAYTYQARTGKLELTPKGFFALSSLPFGETAPLAELLGTTVTGSIWNRKFETLGDIFRSLLNSKPFDLKRGAVLLEASAKSNETLDKFQGNLDAERRARLQRCYSEESAVLAYKGRPLNGIWATAPYLHNGSVPTLYDLLLPPEQRPMTFQVGTREFDPERVGFVTGNSRQEFQTSRAIAEATFSFSVYDKSGVPIPGNSNLGHDYGNAALRPEDRWALVEYMKAVGGRREGNLIAP